MKRILALLTFIVFCAGILNDQKTKKINVEINKQNQIVRLAKVDKNGSATLTLTGNNGNIAIEIKDLRIRKSDNIRLYITNKNPIFHVFHEVKEYAINDGLKITGEKAKEIYGDLHNVKKLSVYRGYNLLGYYDLKRLKPKLKKYQKHFFKESSDNIEYS